MPSDDETDGPDPLGPARPILTAALGLGGRAAGTGDHAGAYALFACAARLARKVRGLGEVADFRLERALEAAEGEGEPAARPPRPSAAVRIGRAGPSGSGPSVSSSDGMTSSPRRVRGPPLEVMVHPARAECPLPARGRVSRGRGRGVR